MTYKWYIKKSVLDWLIKNSDLDPSDLCPNLLVEKSANYVDIITKKTYGKSMVHDIEFKDNYADICFDFIERHWLEFIIEWYNKEYCVIAKTWIRSYNKTYAPYLWFVKGLCNVNTIFEWTNSINVSWSKSYVYWKRLSYLFSLLNEESFMEESTWITQKNVNTSNKKLWYDSKILKMIKTDIEQICEWDSYFNETFEIPNNPQYNKASELWVVDAVLHLRTITNDELVSFIRKQDKLFYPLRKI